MEQRSDILQGINRIFREALVCSTQGELGRTCLKVAEETTQSKFGFIGLLNQQGLLDDIAISDPGWAACSIDDQTGHRQVPSGFRVHGLYGRVLRSGKGFFTNNPAAHPDHIGLPSGHPPLAAFLGVPLIHNHTTIGMIGLGNRTGGYRQAELVALEALAVAMVEAIMRKQTETALYDSEEQFRAIYNSPNVAMGQADAATGRLLGVNPAYTQLLGYTSEDLTDCTITALTHPDERAAAWEGHCRMVHGETASYVAEKRLKHKDGHFIWCLVSVTLVRNAAAEPVRTVAMIFDISESKRITEELERAKQETERERKFLEAVFDALPIGLCITDEKGGVLRSNGMDEQIWGRRPPTANIEDYREYRAWWVESGRPVAPDEWASARAIKYGETVVGQLFEIERFDGTRSFIHNSAAPVRTASGAIIGSAVSIQDVTSQQHFETALREAKKAAEAASRAKTEFLANMSHEIRTPMTVFMNIIELLQQIDRTPEHQPLLEMAAQANQRLRALVNDVLDFSKIEARRVELRNALQATVALLQTKAREKQLDLALEVASAVPETVWCDWYRLEQVLINLIGNAIKFSEHGNVRVAVQLNDGALHFAVSDSGIGIPVGKHALVFETFSQVDGSITRKHGGTGLGLAIAKGLVELMGGTIGVQSTPGHGSVFSFTVPLLLGGVRLPAASSPPTACALKPVRILLAEDDPMVQRTIQTTLGYRNWQTTAVASGREAVRKWQDGEVDLILMDLQMPDMDGLEATRVIRRLQEDNRMRVGIIGLTAHASQTVREQCLAAGMDEVLSKPFEIERLYATIERYLKTTQQ